jgi:hypothetical protein
MDYDGHEQGNEFLHNRKNLLEDSGLAKSSIGKASAPGSQKRTGQFKTLPFSLKKLKEDEARWSDIKSLTIYEFLGKPSFKNSKKIPEKEVAGALESLLKLCESKGISLEVRGFYPPLEIYRFLTTELFAMKTEMILQPDCICKLIYEDYHPNHKITIEDVSMRFLELWLGRRLKEFNFELTDVFVTSQGQIRSKFDVLSKLQFAFEEILNISQASMYFSQVSYNWDEKENSGTGHAEGMIKYTATLKDGNTKIEEGAFKFYLTNESNGWEVFYFVLPGFSW